MFHSQKNMHYFEALQIITPCSLAEIVHTLNLYSKYMAANDIAIQYNTDDCMQYNDCMYVLIM